MRTQQLRQAQDEIGCSRTFWKGTNKPNPDHLGNEHVDRLPEHDSLCLDPPYSPTNDAESIDHRRVTVGADERIGKEHSIGLPNDLAEVFEVDLMDDSRRGGDDPKVVERFLSPLEELVSLAIAIEFLLAVDSEGNPGVEGIDLDGVVDDQITRKPADSPAWDRHPALPSHHASPPDRPRRELP